eukprot:1476213-Ditylum_brightwellii.AAC.1
MDGTDQVCAAPGSESSSPVDLFQFLLGLPLLPVTSDVKVQCQTLIFMMEALLDSCNLPAKYFPIIQATTPSAPCDAPALQQAPSAADPSDLLNLFSPALDDTTQPPLVQPVLIPAAQAPQPLIVPPAP